MATLTNPGDGASISSNPLATGGVKPTVKATPDNYTTLGELVDDYAKPDNRDLLIKTYSDQGITGFLKLTGAVNAAATQDEVQYWEEAVATLWLLSSQAELLTGPVGHHCECCSASQRQRRCYGYCQRKKILRQENFCSVY